MKSLYSVNWHVYLSRSTCIRAIRNLSVWAWSNSFLALLPRPLKLNGSNTITFKLAFLSFFYQYTTMENRAKFSDWSKSLYIESVPQ